MTIEEVHASIVACERCARLRRYCERIGREKRRAFLGGALSAVTVGSGKAQSAIAQNAVARTPPGPLVWPDRLVAAVPTFACWKLSALPAMREPKPSGEPIRLDLSKLTAMA